MRTTIFAALVAFATSAAVLAPAEAASLTITTGDSGHSRWRDNDRYDNDRYVGRYERRQGMRWRERREVRECEVRTERYWRDGELVVERTRDCY